MRKLIISILLFLLVTGFTLQVNAQVVKTPSSNAVVVISSSMPVRGLTKVQVESRFGQPNTRQGPTGKPAIYRWDYDGYSVFFENDYVIHTVAH